ncbi:hypothetical protein M404DRAFT_994807 [Pisolithus tinctorius Marx 270]|uniref:Uncharacterized protein n=1 Tax=Pisolithus tinctorius Marx 270 TaxID=870435 RepID=A0A0C3KNE9_PISTI|nr:hypothetical protein M404DRAFT_994807 [Pisolithus tinctorius Marx 270]
MAGGSLGKKKTRRKKEIDKADSRRCLLARENDSLKDSPSTSTPQTSSRGSSVGSARTSSIRKFLPQKIQAILNLSYQVVPLIHCSSS